MTTIETNSSQFQRRVLAPLEQLGQALKRHVLVEGCCGCLAAMVGLCAVQFLLDRLLVLGTGPRAALLLGVAAVTARALHRRVIRPAAVRVDVNDIAAILERKHREFGDQLISAVAFATGAGQNPHRDSPALVAALIDRSVARFRSLPTRTVLRRDRHRRYLALGAAAFLASAAALWAAPETMAIYVARNLMLQDVPWPVSTRIVLEGARNRTLRWPIGDDLTLVATALDRPPASLGAAIRFSSGEEIVRDMDRRGRNRFLLDYGPLDQSMQVSFLIRKVGVDERTDWYRIEAVPRPSVQSVRIEVTPPAYARQKPWVLPQGQAGAEIIRGSSVRIEAVMSKAVVRATLRSMADARAQGEAEVRDGRRVSVAFTPDRTGTFFLDVADEAGLEDRHPVTYTFNLTRDPAPKVRLTLPGAGEWIVPNAVLNLTVDCEDNLGLQSVALIHQVKHKVDSGATTRPTEQRETLGGFVPRQLRFHHQSAWPLLPLTLRPGDQLTLKVRAADYQPESAAASRVEARSASGQTATPSARASSNPDGTGESVAFTLRVVTPAELLAELGRREQEWRGEFEQIIKAQEQINRRIVALRDTSGAAALSAERAVGYGREARTQRQQIGRMKRVVRQFEQILAELKVNQLATPVVRRRLGRGVLTPLGKLIRTDVLAAAELIDRLRLRFDDGLADELERAQEGLLRAMYGVLANMLKWEGYNEAVALLRDIVRLQEGVTKDTEARLEAEIEKMFGGEATKQPTSSPEKRP